MILGFLKQVLKRILPPPIQKYLGWIVYTLIRLPVFLVPAFLNRFYLISTTFAREKNPFLRTSITPAAAKQLNRMADQFPFRKVIIWGHTNFDNTFYHIDTGFLRAFQSLGYDTYYFDDRQANKLQNFDFENCLFLTSSDKEKNIPLLKSASYIFHYVDKQKYRELDLRFINFANYMRQCDEGISPHHPENGVVKVADCTFWDDKSRTLYQPWATDLLPYEIDTENIVPYDPKRKNINYIGAMYPHNREQFLAFGTAAKTNGKRFKTGKSISDERSYHLVRNSYISVDLRGSWHIECGYIPCRVYKNISYGMFTGVNSENVGKMFGDYVAYSPDPVKLFEVTETAYRRMNREKMAEAMAYVRDYHTYINRAQNILKFL